jgi:hypothetical protein
MAIAAPKSLVMIEAFLALREGSGSPHFGQMVAFADT